MHFSETIGLKTIIVNYIMDKLILFFYEYYDLRPIKIQYYNENVGTQ